MASEQDQNFSSNATPAKEDQPLSTSYNLNPIVPGNDKPKTFMDIHGKTVLVAVAGCIAALVTIALIIDILIGESAVTPKGVVVSEIPKCSAMGADIMTSGGSVVDGAIVSSLCLSIHLPHRSGPGSGGYILVKKEKDVKEFDFMAQAPEDISYYSATDKDGVNSILIPGYFDGLKSAHKKHGRLDWSVLMNKAAQAANGYEVTPSLREALQEFPESFQTGPFKNLFFTPDKTIPQELPNDRMEKLLLSLAKWEKGSFLSLYKKQIHEDAPHLSNEDLESYEVEVDPTDFIKFKSYEIHSSSYPSSGSSLLETLDMLFSTTVTKAENEDEKAIEESERLHSLLEYLKFTSAQHSFAGDGSSSVSREVAAAMKNDTLMAVIRDLVKPESVFGDTATSYVKECLPSDLLTSLSPSGPDSVASPETSGVGLVVMDDMGDVAVMVSSLFSPFGSKVLSTDGYFYNNFASAFSSESTNNAIGSNKRPSTSLSPVVAFEPDNLCAPHVAASSSGSRASVTASSQVMHAVLQRDMTIGAANLEGRVFATASVQQPDVDPPEETFEDSRITDDVLSLLKAKGHIFTGDSSIEIVSIASKVDDSMFGASDQRVISDNAGVYAF